MKPTATVVKVNGKDDISVQPKPITYSADQLEQKIAFSQRFADRLTSDLAEAQADLNNWTDLLAQLQP